MPFLGRLLTLVLLGLLLVLPSGATASLPDPGVPGSGRDADTSPAQEPSPGERGGTVALQVLPPLAQPGDEPADADEARTVAVARVTPARAGIPVRLLGRSPEGWSEIGIRHTDRHGTAETAVPPFEAYRAEVGDLASEPVRADRWQLAFDDGFERTELGPRWGHRGDTYNPEGLRACSKGDPRAIGLPGRVLRLWVRRDPDRSDRCPTLRRGRYEGPYAYRINGHVSTEDTFAFTYGVAAARMKFQELPGQHAAFWMQPKSPPAPGGYGPRFTGAEIDVIEWFGRKQGGSGLAQFTYHRDEVGNRVKTGGVLEGTGRFLQGSSDSWTERYHVFSVEWTPEEYVFRIDGQITWRSRAGISHRPQFLILSLLSSDYEIAAAGDQGLGSQFAEVDWVRVWQQ